MMNPEIVLPLDTMSAAEKFEVVQAVWDDLVRTSEHVPTADWYAQYLREMKESVAAGEEEFLDLSEAERIISENTP